MIGGLQGDFGNLDIKYLKQNISKCRSHISGSFRRTPRHCAKWLWNSPGKRYRRIRICLTEEVETPSFPIRRQAPDAKYSDGMSAKKNSGCETSGWNVAAVGWNSYPSGMWQQPDGIPTRVEWVMIPVQVEWAGSHTPCIQDLLMAKDFKALALHVSKLSIALPWIPKNSP